jgi:hypothetical protein
MNVGPTKDGKIIPLFEERLRQLGQWLRVNGESIYSSKPWSHQNDTMTRNIWYIYIYILDSVSKGSTFMQNSMKITHVFLIICTKF